jgi:hypothetical protein
MPGLGDALARGAFVVPHAVSRKAIIGTAAFLRIKVPAIYSS